MREESVLRAFNHYNLSAPCYSSHPPILILSCPHIEHIFLAFHFISAASLQRRLLRLFLRCLLSMNLLQVAPSWDPIWIKQLLLCSWVQTTNKQQQQQHIEMVQNYAMINSQSMPLLCAAAAAKEGAQSSSSALTQSACSNPCSLAAAAAAARSATKTTTETRRKEKHYQFSIHVTHIKSVSP